MQIGRCPTCNRAVDQDNEPVFYESRAFHVPCFYRWLHGEISRLEGKMGYRGQKLTETESRELSELREIAEAR